MKKMFHFYIFEFIEQFFERLFGDFVRNSVSSGLRTLAEKSRLQSKNNFDFFWLRVFEIFRSITLHFWIIHSPNFNYLRFFSLLLKFC